ncbi:EAL domain-containing protein, partial [Enterobacter asburiae]|uniref:EAL domain-containing protein n=1 Tax=Enterobacter asburiae TaxID=61645 RepID=UPI0020732180
VHQARNSSRRGNKIPFRRRIDSSKPIYRQNRCCKNGSDHRFRFPSGPHIEWLTVLDFDEIKIDRIFIANIDDPVKRALLVSVVKGLRGTGKPLMFEGVETPGQFEFVRSLGPGYLVQGWYTGKPETISAMNIQG